MTLANLVRHFGSQAAAARALGVSPQRISSWKKRPAIPIGMQFLIEVKTHGELRADREFKA